jgi:hypothetical protein
LFLWHLFFFQQKEKKTKHGIAGDLEVQSIRRFLPHLSDERKARIAGEKAAGAKMSGPPPGLQRKNAMDANSKSSTIKVTLWIV